MMKKPAVLAVILAFAALSLFACSKDGKDTPVGTWSTELYGSEQIIEFTTDGYFFDHTSGYVNRYRTEGNNIVTYVEGEEGSEISLPYSVKDDVLVYGRAEYKRAGEED